MLVLTSLPQALVDVNGALIPLRRASLSIVDFVKLSRFCGFGDYLSELARTRQSTEDFFGNTPTEVQQLLVRWSYELGPSFWNSPDDDHWFNVTFRDPFHAAAFHALKTSSYESWQYLHWYFRLWRHSVEHKKKTSVATSFAHMRTLPPMLLAEYYELDTVMDKCCRAPP